MAYTLVKGKFIIRYATMPKQGPEPDGDTIKFQPDNPDLLLDLPGGGRPTDFNKFNMCNLRFEGIDAPELHFQEMRQPLQWAAASRDFMLKKAGYTQVTFLEDSFKVASAKPDDAVPGYVLTNGNDGHGRAIAFVFAGASQIADGTRVWLGDADDVAMSSPSNAGAQRLPAVDIENSLNVQLLKDGLAYPMYYTSLPAPLRKTLTGFVKPPREQDTGMWKADRSQVLTQFVSVADLEQHLIWPKLFRRLASFFGEGHQGLGTFDAWLRDDEQNRDDRVLLADRPGEVSNMHDVLQVQGNQIKMRYLPEAITVLPDDA